MADTRISFGPLIEDQAKLLSPGLLKALNLYPRRRSFGPFKNLQAQSNALTARCWGAVATRDKDDNVYVYAGDASKLYESINYTFTDESKGGGYTLASSDVWEFAVWDYADKIIATNFTDAVQSMAIGGGAAGAFADMITSTLKPKAKHVAVLWPAFVVLGNTNDGTDGHMRNRVWWSAYRDETDFDPSAATQCDYEDLATGGTVQRIAGMSQYGLVFQTGAVRTMQYRGPGPVFDLRPIADAPGTPISNSVVSYGRNCFFISEQGFHAIRDGALQSIGDSLVDRSFWSEFDVTNRRTVSAAIDPRNNVVAWAYSGTGGSGEPNKIKLCKWDELKWADVEIDTELIFSTQTQGYTLESLDNVSNDIDAGVITSFDSDAYKGGQYRAAAFDTAHKLATFTGANMKATLETADFELTPVPGGRSKISNTRPLIDGGSARVSLSSRTALNDVVSYDKQSADMNKHGECPLLSEGRYHRLAVSISSSLTWSHIQGIDLTYAPTGRW